MSNPSFQIEVPEILHAAELLAGATNICVLSGAGLSKASGIPTYRDQGGLWTNEENLRYSHIDGYRENPVAFCKFWSSRRDAVMQAKPNPAHYALANLLVQRPGSSLITQNVDGLLQKAGASKVLELHGNLARLRCDYCGWNHGFWIGM